MSADSELEGNSGRPSDQVQSRFQNQPYGLTFSGPKIGRSYGILLFETRGYGSLQPKLQPDLCSLRILGRFFVSSFSTISLCIAHAQLFHTFSQYVTATKFTKRGNERCSVGEPPTCPARRQSLCSCWFY